MIIHPYGTAVVFQSDISRPALSCYIDLFNPCFMRPVERGRKNEKEEARRKTRFQRENEKKVEKRTALHGK